MRREIKLRIDKGIYENLIRLEAANCRMPIGSYLAFAIELIMSSDILRGTISDVINSADVDSLSDWEIKFQKLIKDKKNQ